MKVLVCLLFAVAAVAVTARHRKEWQRVDSSKISRERLQVFFKTDVPACTRGAGFYRDPQDCHQFVRCVDEFGNGRHFSVFVGRCEPGLVFDENVSACNWPELAAPCSNSPQKHEQIRQPFSPEEVAQDNVIAENQNWSKSHPEKQQEIHTPQQSDSQQEILPIAQEIQIEAQEPVYQKETENDVQSFEQSQEQIPEKIRQENIQISQLQDFEDSPGQISQQVYQQNIQVPVKQQQFEEVQEETSQAKLVPGISQEPIKTQQQQNTYDEPSYIQIDKSQAQEQIEPSGFQEVTNQESHKFEITADSQQEQYPQQESQQWWVPEDTDRNNLTNWTDQTPLSANGEEPIFCSEEGFFKHPEKCNQFIRCVKLGREAYAVHFFECPKQLVFSEKDSSCVVPDAHSCHSNTRQKRQASNTKLQCPDEGFFRHPQDCRAFYRCVKTESGSYETHFFSCPANLVFDEEYTTCNWPEKAPPCQGQLKNTRKPIQAEKKPNKRPTSAKKPGNEHINESITQETFSKKRSTEKPRSTTRSYNQNEPKCKRQGFYRNNKDCTKFIKCVKKGNYFIRYDLSCPQNYAYDDVSKRCIAQRYVTTCNRNKPPVQNDEETTINPETTSEESNQTPRSSGSEEIVCEEEGYFRHPEDCNRFYRCVDFDGSGEQFVRYDFNCPEGLEFDEINSVCNWPDPNAPCESGNGKTGENGGTEENGGTGENEGSEENGGIGENEETDESETGEGNGINEENHESSTSAGESNTESIETTSSSSTGETNEEKNDTDNESNNSESENGCTKEGFYRNPDDCNKFYRCVDFSGEGTEFIRYDFNCPEGLVFDEVNSVCNWPSDSEPCDTNSGGGNEDKDSQEESGATTSSSTIREEDNSEDDNEPPSTDRDKVDDGASTNSPSDENPTSESGSDVTTLSSTDENVTEPEGDGEISNGECTEAGFFRNPEDCNKFYRCVDYNGDGQEFVKYDFTCPEGLVFDETNSVCNWPEQSAPCEGGGPNREQSTTTREENESDSSHSTSDKDGNSSTQTTSGYSSTDSTSIADEEGSQSTYSSTTEVIDSTSSGRNQNDNISDSSDGESGGYKGECTEEGFFQNPEDCGKFYRCVDFNGDGQQFVRYDFDCPEGLVFDEVNSVCNWPDQSPKCESKSSNNETTASQEETSSQTESTIDQSSDFTESATRSSTLDSTQSTSYQPTEQDQSSTQQPQESTEDQSTTTSSSFAEDSECSEPGFYRCKDECNKFYRCVEENGELVRYDFKCPDGLIFDDQNKKCDWPSSELTCELDSSTTSTYESSITPSHEPSTTAASSQSTTQSSPSSTSSETSSTSSAECIEEGYFRDPEDCNKYYRCIDEGDGKLIKEDFACAEDEVFDEEMRYCNRKDLAPPCDNAETSSQSQTTSQSDSSQSTNGRETTSSQTSTQSSTKSEDESTSSQTSTQSSTKGEDESTSSQTSTQSSTKGEDESNCTQAGFFRCPEDCTKFYRCVEEDNGNLVRYDFQCPDGLIFDEENGRCDWPSSDLTCDTESPSAPTKSTTESSQTTSSRTTSSSPEGTSTSGTSSDSVEGCTEEGFFQNPDDCSKYYRCLDEGDGTLTREDFACEEDEVFDEEMRYCNRKDLAPPCNEISSTTESGQESTTQATSEQEPENTSSSPDSTSSSSDSGECEEEGFHRDPNDCNKFYRCVDFRGDGQSLTRYDFDCPEGLVFDETLDVCNWPSSVPSCEASGGSINSTEGGSRSTESGNLDSSTSSDGESPTSSTTQEQITSTLQSEASTTDSNESSSSSNSDSTEAESGTTTTGSASSSSSTSEGNSSNNIECTEEGFFRHPEDCNKFYRCVDFAGTGESFVRYDFDCPEGLVFDEVNSVCNWPNQSPSCESGSRADGSDNQTTTDATDDSTEDNGSSSGSTVSETVSDSDSTSQGIDSTTRAQTTKTSTSSSPSTSSPTDEFHCEDEGYFRHPTDCKKYYECRLDEETGELVRIDCECPDGHVWDDEGWYCNVEELSPPCENSSSFRCTEEGFFRDPEDCTRYYQCNRTGSGENDFTRESFQCEEGLVFDESGRYCNAPELSEPCDESPSTSDSTINGDSTSTSDSNSSSDLSTSSDSTSNGDSSSTTSSGISGDQDACTKEGFFRNPEDCTKYYQCSKNDDGSFDRSDYTCPDGRIFDETSNYCNDPQLSDEPCETSSSDPATSPKTSSTDSSSDNGGNSDTSPPNGLHGSEGECSQEGFFRNPDDCNKFYRCVDFSGSGESFVRYDFDCPEGLHFDEVNSVCNWPTMTPPCENRNWLLFESVEAN